MKEAMLYKRLEKNAVHCFLCAQHCRINPGELGKCGVRQNRSGELHSLVYGKLIAQNIDPIEKKPLYHYYPKTTSYSIATVGCNFTCVFCQNSDISQAPREYRTIIGRDVPAKSVVEQAIRNECATISYTYTEPTIFMEYAFDVAVQARESGIENVFVSNGFMTSEALDVIAPHLGAANIDLKAFSDRFYRERCGARLDPVLKTIEGMKKKGIWVEVTTLVIPGLNDSEEELRRIAEFLVSTGDDIPWHVSRFHPDYRLTDVSPTPVQTIQKARRIGLDAGLHYVYTGNVPGDDGENTYCRSCGELLISRLGYNVKIRDLKAGACGRCGVRLSGVGFI